MSNNQLCVSIKADYETRHTRHEHLGQPWKCRGTFRRNHSQGTEDIHSTELTISLDGRRRYQCVTRANQQGPQSPGSHDQSSANRYGKGPLRPRNNSRSIIRRQRRPMKPYIGQLEIQLLELNMTQLEEPLRIRVIAEFLEFAKHVCYLQCLFL